MKALYAVCVMLSALFILQAADTLRLDLPDLKGNFNSKQMPLLAVSFQGVPNSTTVKRGTLFYVHVFKVSGKESPAFFRASATGQVLREGMVNFYKETGEAYFQIRMRNIKIVAAEVSGSTDGATESYELSFESGDICDGVSVCEPLN